MVVPHAKDDDSENNNNNNTCVPAINTVAVRYTCASVTNTTTSSSNSGIKITLWTGDHIREINFPAIGTPRLYEERGAPVRSG